MPEAFTYYDMQRMIAAQVPAGRYYLELHPRWFRKQSSAIPTVQNPELLSGLEKQEFDFTGLDVRFHGKALGIPLKNGIWLRLQFALHGHGLPACREEYNAMVAAWDQEKDSKRHVYILAAIVGPDMCIILVDRYDIPHLTFGFYYL